MAFNFNLYFLNMKIKYRPEIDGLRAIAVLLVVIYHAFPSAIPGGFIGVDIFFVISGFLITSILNTEISTGKYSIKEFYRRRIDRLFPALLLVMFSVYIFGWFTLFSDEFMQLGKQLAGGAGFIANIVLYSETGYFNATSATKPFLHLWSLGIEEQFYLLFPIILYFSYKRKLNLVLVVCVLAVVSFALNIFSINENIERTFYLPQYRHWELLLGAVLALQLHGEKGKQPKKWLAVTLTVLSVSTILITAFLLTSSVPFPGWYALLPVLASVFLIFGLQRDGLVKSILSSKPFVFVGLISYPLYLWHWPLFSLAHIINGSTPPDEIMLGLLVASFVLATLTYWLVERPLKSVKSWKVKTIPMLILMAIIGVAGYITYAMNGIDTRSNIEASKEVSRQLNGALWQYSKNDNCLTRFKTHLATDLPWWFCSLKKNSEPDLLLLGNSYANHLYPGIANNNKLKDLNVLSIGTQDVTAEVLKPTDAMQSEQLAFVNHVIETTESIKYIIISGINPKADDYYIDGLLKRMSVITKHNARVIIFYPHVRLSDDIKACFSRPLKAPQKTCESDLTEVNDIRQHMAHLKERVSAIYPNTLYFDPNLAFCDDEKCSSVKNGLPMYRDEYKHLSEYGSMKVGDEFAKWAKYNTPDLTK
ncbi:TPA: acyltransferase family protein [Escherichia coli]|uniref:acyltransferase family protein n=1 Tax=Escherichia coli TaxID=562 RepID=UPI001D0CBAAC|nr:acyltransferase family protein [Escherichia coli]EMD4022608.1 acyltransferase [Escherichia coli]